MLGKKVVQICTEILFARAGKCAVSETRIRNIIKAVKASGDNVSRLHADYIIEKLNSWKSCDIGAIERIGRLYV